MASATLKSRIDRLYYGRTAQSRLFHILLAIVDIAVIAYFLATVRVEHVSWYRIADLIIFVVFAAELAVRFWIDKRRSIFLFRLSTLADLVVLASLILPFLIDNLGFLRILRTLRFLRLLRATEELRRLMPFHPRNEDVIIATLNLGVFIFVVTSTVWVLEARINPDINNWGDALYFTVATLTTTGFGDITLKDPIGRLLTVFIMIFGVALFLRLAQSIFRPYKVEYKCPECGLLRHDPDASHCKHCGHVVHIETEGVW